MYKAWLFFALDRDQGEASIYGRQPQKHCISSPRYLTSSVAYGNDDDDDDDDNNNNNNNNNNLKVKYVACSSQGSHTGQLEFCNWLADGSTTG